MSSGPISHSSFLSFSPSREEEIESPFRLTPKTLQTHTLGIFQELYRMSFGISSVPQTFNEMCAFFERNPNEPAVRELEDALKKHIGKASKAVEGRNLSDMKEEIKSMKFVSHSLSSQRVLPENKREAPQFFSVVDIRNQSAGKSKSKLVESYHPMYAVAKSTYNLAWALASLPLKERQEWTQNLKGCVSHYQECAALPQPSPSGPYVSFSEIGVVGQVAFPRSQGLQLPAGLNEQRFLKLFNQLLEKHFPDRKPVESLIGAEEFLEGISSEEILDPTKVTQLRNDLNSKLARQQTFKLDQPKQIKEEEPENLNAFINVPRDIGLVPIFNRLLWEKFHLREPRVESEEGIDRFLKNPPEDVFSEGQFEIFCEEFHGAVQKQIEKQTKLDELEQLLFQINSKEEQRVVSTYHKLIEQHFGDSRQLVGTINEVKEHVEFQFEDPNISSEVLSKFHSELIRKLKQLT